MIARNEAKGETIEIVEDEAIELATVWNINFFGTLESSFGGGMSSMMAFVR